MISSRKSWGFLFSLLLPATIWAADSGCADPSARSAAIGAAIDRGNLVSAEAKATDWLRETQCPVHADALQHVYRIAVLRPSGPALATLKSRADARGDASLMRGLRLVELEIAARSGSGPVTDDISRLLVDAKDARAIADIAAFAYRIRDTEAALQNPMLTSWAFKQLSSSDSPDVRLDCGMFLTARLLRAGKQTEALDLARRNLMTIASVGPPKVTRTHEVLRTIALAQWQLGNTDSAAEQFQAALTAFSENRAEILAESRADPALFRWRAGRLFLDYGEFLVRQAEACPDAERRQVLLASAIQVVEQFKEAELEQLLVGLCPSDGSQAKPIAVRSAPNTLLLYPVRWSNSSQDIIAITPSGIELFQPEASPAEIDKASFGMRTTVEARDPNHLKWSQALYQSIVRPLESTLAQHQVKTIGFVPDAALRLIPISAVHDGERYLIERFSITTAPTLRYLLSDVPSGNQQSLVLASLDESRDGYPALPGVRVETDFLISSLQPEWNIAQLNNAAFTVAGVRQQLSSGDARWVHFATHGEFLPDANESFLLAYDGRINANDLRSMLTPGAGASGVELLSLTACQTAAGDDRAALGMAGILLATGARNVLASLWSLRDAAAAPLVSDFYRELRQHPDRPAQALRTAQLASLKSENRNAPDDWAPFMILGKLQP